MKYVIFLIRILVVPIYIFIAAGFSKETIAGAIAWVLFNLGYSAYTGGEKKFGAIVCVIGLIIALAFLV